MSGRTWTSLSLRAGTAAAEPLAYVRRPESLRGGNRVELLAGGGEAYPAMLRAIAAARERVLLGTYIVRSDRTGDEFADALVERARAGVRVLFMYDALGSLGTVDAAWLARLRAAGIEVLEFAPLAPWRKNWGFNRRNHQKVLVLDGQVAFTGGLNLGDEYRPAAGDGGWLDLHARLVGPAARELEQVFARAWRRGGGSFPDELLPPLDPARGEPAEGGAPVLTLDNVGLRRRHQMHAAKRHAIHQARRSILIANAYFIPDVLLRRAFRDAVRRGVSVRVLVPAESDVRVAQFASQHLYRRLLRAGVRLYEVQGRMMHAKAAAIDGVWSTIGSFNLDRRSFLHNLEAGLIVVDPAFTGRLEATIRSEMALAREVTLGDWAQRPGWRRALEWVSFRFRYWL